MGFAFFGALENVGFAFFGGLEFGGVLSELSDVGVGAGRVQPHMKFGCTGKGSPSGNLGFPLAFSFHILMGLTLGNQSTSVEDFLYCITGQPLSST